MASFPLGKIRCTTCGGFVNRYLGAYRRLINMGYSRMKALDALGIKRYCCRMHIENPDIIRISLTPDEIKNVRKELGNDRLANRIIDDMYTADPYNEDDPDSLVNTVGTWKIVSRITGVDIPEHIIEKENEQIRVSNEQIEKAKRMNRAAFGTRDERPLYDTETGERVSSVKPTITIWPTVVEEVKVNMKVIKVRKPAIKRPADIFSVGAKRTIDNRGRVVYQRPVMKMPETYSRAAVREVPPGTTGKNIYLSTSGLSGWKGKGNVEVILLEKGEKVPEGYEEAYVNKVTLIPVLDESIMHRAV